MYEIRGLARPFFYFPFDSTFVFIDKTADRHAEQMKFTKFSRALNPREEKKIRKSGDRIHV